MKDIFKGPVYDFLINESLFVFNRISNNLIAAFCILVCDKVSTSEKYFSKLKITPLQTLSISFSMA